MKTFLKILNAFFVILGVIFFILLLATGYFFWKDPLNLRPLISGLNQSSENNSEQENHPLLSSSQEAALEAIGIDPSKLPTEITPELEDCATEKLGVERVMEIKGGSAPTASDILKAKDCF